METGHKERMPWKISVLKIRDPVLFDPWIGEPDLGSGIRDEEKIWIRDPG
jgi:hypothetical protein